MSVHRIATPYLIYLGDVANTLDAKTGRGMVDWRPELCVGQLREVDCGIDLGLPDLSPSAARDAGARSLVIGVAPCGGRIEEHWVATLVGALQSGLDIVSGLHHRLEHHALLARMAVANNQRLIDVRTPPPDIALASGRRRRGRRLLTIGTDCCVGKKYTALAIERRLAELGRAATFRATGQTGILIAGRGVALDAVVADFVAGAAEELSPDNDAGHWDIIEGQGSLFHPAYAGVTLGLLHGSQPDALVLCHDATRTHVDEYEDYALPELERCIDVFVAAARLTNPDARMIGASINSSTLPEGERRDYLDQLRARLDLPCVDPMIDGVDDIIAMLDDETAA